MFDPSREQARRFLIEAWRKYRERSVMTELELLAAEHIAHHPEYHAILEAGEDSLDREWLPELGETNPFLHLSLHLTISEQLSIDQPPGIKAAYERLLQRTQDPHAAQHLIMDCLAEVVWQAQRNRSQPDGLAYLECLNRKSR
ncbi:uncharacterized protein DUF1841 [Sulfuritortus calidifontis]|uniref:Uncharacterized protein DUF1841 n=1 Tax=Sulfuritortus calidifontis TaxID=1914471 RepID=A0A4R3JX62_9PROT|nr:DUF1841 family protein [Sulfuritortus calidifontis]TCS72980.1 uncharacterized protein DUF1841 [Sulfuritortus calidifontis]